MCQYKYEGIIKALKYAEFTGQSVNVGLNKHEEPINIEGIIKKVDDYDFTIILEETGKKDEIQVSEVEYVLYS